MNMIKISIAMMIIITVVINIYNILQDTRNLTTAFYNCFLKANSNLTLIQHIFYIDLLCLLCFFPHFVQYVIIIFLLSHLIYSFYLQTSTKSTAFFHFFHLYNSICCCSLLLLWIYTIGTEI